MKEEIVKVANCLVCPFSTFDFFGRRSLVCINFKRSPKPIEINISDDNYPKWCPLKKKSIKIELIKNKKTLKK